jgi:glycosyltransferase involved in cell wall biosynthesis
MNILLCGHACGPNLGSEPGLTWNWAWHLAERHRVWAIVHPQHRFEIEAYLQSNPRENLKFVWTSLPRLMDPWNPASGERNIRLHYMLWQWAALKEARRLHQQVRFNVCHYVSWGTVNWAPRLWRLNVPFLWGPVGGGQLAPLNFRRYLGPLWPFQAVRNWRVKLTKYSPSLRGAIRHSALILAANGETKELLHAAGAPVERVRLFLDNGLPTDLLAKDTSQPPRRTELLLHWSGRLEPRKALPLALESVAQAIRLGVNVSLEISGAGPERGNCERFAAELGISNRVCFLGRIPRVEVLSRFRHADALLFTSLQDSFGSVCLEAMAQGLPVLTLDHQGVGDFLPAAASWKVPLTNPTATIKGLADAIVKISNDPEDRLRRACAALEFARSQTWTNRVVSIERVYEELYRDANQRA